MKEVHYKVVKERKMKVVCYECNKPRHYKSECPKKEFDKKRIFFKKKNLMYA